MAFLDIIHEVAKIDTYKRNPTDDNDMPDRCTARYYYVKEECFDSYFLSE